MGDFVFRLPDIGEGIAEAEIVAWHVTAGDAVREGAPLADVMTDKATVEIAAPVGGVVRRVLGLPGSRIAVGAELAVIEIESNAEAGPIPSAPDIASSEARAPPVQRERQPGKVLAAPAVRARGKMLGVDLATVAGTGPEGRIVHADLDRLFARQAPPATATADRLPPDAESEDIKIFGLRRRVAERMLEAKRSIPHFTYVEEVNVTALEALRRSLNSANSGAVHLTILPFVARAIVLAAAKHPAVNSHFHDAEGVVRRFAPVHLGIATQTERGLLVPVLRHAERKDLHELAESIGRLSKEARAGKSNREELTGSTITVTSLGALGGLMATPIINPPEVAIVGVNRIIERPVIAGGIVSGQLLMNLSSSFDHRIIDGHAAAEFIADVRKLLEAPDQLQRTGL